MVARVYISAGLFRISKPGKDVRISSGQDLLFDSATARLNGIYLHGVVPYTSFSESVVSQGGTAALINRRFTLAYDSAAYPRLFFMTQDASTGIIRTGENASDWYAGTGSVNESGTAANRAYLYTSATPVSGGVQFNVYHYYTDNTARDRYSRLLNFYYLVFY